MEQTHKRQRFIPKYEKIIPGIKGSIYRQNPRRRMLYTLIFGRKHFMPFFLAAKYLDLDCYEA